VKDAKGVAFIPGIAPEANVPEGVVADSSGIICGAWTGKMNVRRWVKTVTQ